MPTMTIEPRTCWRCGEQKTQWYFHPRTGIQNHCADCGKRKPGKESYRDSQRSRVYESERAARRIGQSVPITGLQEAQDLVDKITGGSWYTKRFPEGYKKVRVVMGRGKAWARGGYGEIILPHIARGGRWAWVDTVVLHELAHNAVSLVPAHGSQFTAGYLDLLEQHAPNFYPVLLNQYCYRGVKIGVSK